MYLFVAFLVKAQSMLEEVPISLKCLQDFISSLDCSVRNNEALQEVFVNNYFFFHFASFFDYFNQYSGVCKEYKLTAHIIKKSMNYSFSITAKFKKKIYFKKINLRSEEASRFDINFIYCQVDILELDKKHFTVETNRSLIFLLNIME